MGLPGAAFAALLVSFLAASAARADCGPYEDDERTSYRGVTWADFQGPRPVGYQVRLKKVAEKAHIATTLTVDPPQIVVVPDGPDRWIARAPALCVRAFMLKKRSGYDLDKRTTRTLAHEQGHFDITEYFARELRRDLTALEQRARTPERARQGLWKAIEREYRDAVDRWKQMQARYDSETAHNQRIATQNRWLEEIETLLTDRAPQAATQPRIARGAPDPHAAAGAQ